MACNGCAADVLATMHDSVYYMIFIFHFQGISQTVLVSFFPTHVELKEE